MMHHIFEIISEALLITGFVAMLMVIVEFVNIRLKGQLEKRVGKDPVRQAATGAIIGTIPGCLGSFTGTALFEHRILTFGGILSCMIAATGDESFVMLALFPKTFLVLTALLIVLGIIIGIIVDMVSKGKCRYDLKCTCEHHLAYHADDERPPSHWGHGSAPRWSILAVFTGFLVLSAIGLIGDDSNVVRAGLVLVALGAIAVAIWAPPHFLSEHILGHVLKKHVPMIFLWVAATLAILQLVDARIDVPSFVEANRWLMLLFACLIGLIPQSGPHMIFVTLFAQGALPFSILFGNMFVQEGHGLLPMLAFDRKSFVQIKLIKFVIGFALAALLMAFGG